MSRSPGRSDRPELDKATAEQSAVAAAAVPGRRTRQKSSSQKTAAAAKTTTPGKRNANKSTEPTKHVVQPDADQAVAAESQEQVCPWKLRLENLLPQLPSPCPEMKVVRSVGEGTFSTVFLVKKTRAGCDARLKTSKQFYAVKLLVPTACPDRVLTEVECLRYAGGESNVLPLLFAHRYVFSAKT